MKEKNVPRAIPRIVDVYQRHGAAWAALRGTALVEAVWLDQFGALLPAGGAVLDLGCGAGVPLARELVRRGYAVTGLDVTPTMLALSVSARGSGRRQELGAQHRAVLLAEVAGEMLVRVPGQHD
ncbi:class I SAM-dependent methyltransferase [Sphingomonas sp. ACRSK]|nr:class I SAM-dependent methyltransferase [Sphingomonas sp. ACRSK]MCG7349758.1 class I SAM-dependent methyltransferase [Sphingomonas sp. ACRSK]